MTSRSDKPALIVGAGLAGLSAAYRLGERPYLLVEAEDRIGGLCRSVRAAGFTFDYTGHLLHLKRPEIRALVEELVGPENFLRIDRRSGIYSHRTITEYPFQVNTHGLPLQVVRECLMGFADTMQRTPTLGDDPSFHDWALATFGEGICRHFMIPYNGKLFRTDLRSVTADWVSWSIPKPTWPDVVRGALGQNRKTFGYNPTFLYPASGGIDCLPNAFSPHVRGARLNTRLIGVDAAKREATLSTGETIHYSHLISTIPLPELLRLVTDLPRDLARGTGELRHVSVLNLNLGFDAPCSLPHHWLYFPEPEFLFYRVGVYSNLCPASVPEGHSAFYVEISHLPGEAVDVATLREHAVRSLGAVGMIPERAALVQSAAFDIPYGYVVHDRHRRSFLPDVMRHFERHGIASVGRYGAWEYSAMEDALWHGRAAADRMLA